MADLNFQDLSTVQNQSQIGVRTIASAATIAPTTFFTIVTGTTAIADLTIPVTGVHLLCIMHDNASPATYLTSGNIDTAVIPTQNVPCMFLYNPDTASYRGWANNVT